MPQYYHLLTKHGRTATILAASYQECLAWGEEYLGTVWDIVAQPSCSLPYGWDRLYFGSV